MKKILLFLFTGILVFSEGINVDSKDVTKKKGKFYYAGAPMNGEYTVSFSEPVTIKWKSILNDIAVDYEIYKADEIYKDGKNIGETRAYGKNNELLMVNDKKENNSLAKEYYYNGKLVEKISRYKTGTLFYGPYELHYKDGIMKESGNFSIVSFSIPGYSVYNSRRDGEIKRYSENGKIREAINFKDGLRHGNSTYYDENENVTKVEKYSNGVKENK